MAETVTAGSGPFRAHWSANESLSSGEARALQDASLRDQLAYLADHSDFYRRKAAAAGVDLRALRGVADLHQVPFTEKADLRDSLREHPPLGAHLAAPLDDVIQIQASSGTTGSPSYVGLTRADLGVWCELGARAFYANGIRPGDRALHCFGMSRGFVGGVPVLQVLQHMSVCDIPVGAEAGADRLLRVAADQRPTVLVGTPYFLAWLGEQAPEVIGIPARELGVRSISTGGEPGAAIPAHRLRMKSVWGATVREMLGGTDSHVCTGPSARKPRACTSFPQT